MITVVCKFGRPVALFALFVTASLFAAHIVYQQWQWQVVNQSRIEHNRSVQLLPPPSRPARTPASEPQHSGNASVDVAGLIKIEIGEAHTWQTIAKIMVLIWGTFFGIRGINVVFNRLECAAGIKKTTKRSKT